MAIPEHKSAIRLEEKDRDPLRTSLANPVRDRVPSLRTETITLLSGILAVIVAGLLQLDRLPVGVMRDDAMYVMLAKSLASGHGFRCGSGPAHYATTLFGWSGGSECGNQTYIFTPFWTQNAGGITIAAPILDGPNTGLRYVAAIAISLDMHAQVLRDIRPDPDGNKYAFTSATDPATTGQCAAAGASSPTSLTTTNVTCWNDADYGAFYGRTWQHEQCHMSVAIWTMLDSIPDASGERVVATDSSGARYQVLYQTDGYAAAQVRILHASAYLDTLAAQSPTTYNLRWYSPSSQAWPATNVSANNYLAAGC